MRLFTIYLILFATLALSATGYSQQPAVSADKTDILIGEQVQLTLSVKVEENTSPEVKFPSIGDTLTDAIEVVSKTGVDTVKADKSGEGFSLRQQLFITSFDSGVHQIPALLFEVNKSIYETQPLDLTVRTIPIDTTGNIKDIKPIYDVSLSLLDYLKLYWPYVAGGIVLIAIIILVLYYIRRRRNRPEAIPEEPAKPTLPPAEEAIIRLRQIEKERIFEQGKIKEYYTQITDVLRLYIERQFSVEATEQTTREILHNLRYSEVSSESSGILRQVLMLSDMVKFAKEKPAVSESEASIKKAMLFIEKTRIQEKEEPEQDDNKPDV